MSMTFERYVWIVKHADGSYIPSDSNEGTNALSVGLYPTQEVAESDERFMPDSEALPCKLALVVLEAPETQALTCELFIEPPEGPGEVEDIF